MLLRMSIHGSVSTEKFIQTIFRPETCAENASMIAKKLVQLDPNCIRRMLDCANGAGQSQVMRLLHCLQEMDPRPEVESALRHLLHYPNARVQSKATLMLGQKFPEASWLTNWVRCVLHHPDARLRANAVESLWNVPNEANREIFRIASADKNHRVVANALLGLYRMGDTQASERMRLMAAETSPAHRAASAFALGETKDAQFLPDLTTLIHDREIVVRSSAIRAVLTIQKARTRVPVLVARTPDAA